MTEAMSRAIALTTAAFNSDSMQGQADLEALLRSYTESAPEQELRIVLAGFMHLTGILLHRYSVETDTTPVETLRVIATQYADEDGPYRTG